MAMHRNDQSNGVRRRVRSNGVIEECNTPMGRMFLIPADPRPRTLDISIDAAGWERLQHLFQRMRRRR